MKEQKISRLFAAFCWLGVAISGGLSGYMLHLMRKYPGIESFARNTRIALALLAVWLVASAYFTVRAQREKKEKKK